MEWLQHALLSSFVVFTLVLTRVSGVVMTAPIFGTSDVPMRVRAFLAITIAVLVTPLQTTRTVTWPDNLLNYSVYLGAELIVGLTLGIGIMLLFSGVQIAGQLISQTAGIQLADVVNPAFDTSVPVFSQLLFYIALAVFVVTGGHRQVMEALLDTFVWIPPGQASVPTELFETLVNVLTQSFVLGIRAAAPAVTALLLATLVLGLISRTVPQLNVMAVGFGFNSLITLGTLSVSLGFAAWAFQEQVEPSLEMLLSAFHTASPVAVSPQP